MLLPRYLRRCLGRKRCVLPCAIVLLIGYGLHERLFPDAVMQDETGYLVPEHDAEGYTRALRDALTLGAAPKSEMARKAREVATARFDNAELLTRLEQEIASTLARR